MCSGYQSQAQTFTESAPSKNINYSEVGCAWGLFQCKARTLKNRMSVPLIPGMYTEFTYTGVNQEQLR